MSEKKKRHFMNGNWNLHTENWHRCDNFCKYFGSFVAQREIFEIILLFLLLSISTGVHCEMQISFEMNFNKMSIRCKYRSRSSNIGTHLMYTDNTFRQRHFHTERSQRWQKMKKRNRRKQKRMNCFPFNFVWNAQHNKKLKYSSCISMVLFGICGQFLFHSH